MRLPLLPERFLADDLTGIVEQVFDVVVVAVVVVVVVDESMIVAIVMTAMCMDVTVAVAGANNIVVSRVVERLAMVAHIANFCLTICCRMSEQSFFGKENKNIFG